MGPKSNDKCPHKGKADLTEGYRGDGHEKMEIGDWGDTARDAWGHRKLAVASSRDFGGSKSLPAP